MHTSDTAKILYFDSNCQYYIQWQRLLLGEGTQAKLAGGAGCYGGGRGVGSSTILVVAALRKLGVAQVSCQAQHIVGGEHAVALVKDCVALLIADKTSVVNHLRRW